MHHANVQCHVLLVLVHDIVSVMSTVHVCRLIYIPTVHVYLCNVHVCCTMYIECSNKSFVKLCIIVELSLG